jgi:hypothetical protein
MVAVRIAVLLCAVAATVAWMLVWRKCSIKRRAQAVLILSWTAHVALFTVAAQCHWCDPATLNLWSGAVRAHGLLASLFLAIDMLTDGGCDNA